MGCISAQHMQHLTSPVAEYAKRDDLNAGNQCDLLM
jgi:hypothetical protein